jgi:hypothetical protein
MRSRQIHDVRSEAHLRGRSPQYLRDVEVEVEVEVV